MSSILIAAVDLGTTKTCAVIAEVHADPYLRRDLKILGVGQSKNKGIRKKARYNLSSTFRSSGLVNTFS